MPERNQAALDFLLTRRSTPAKTLEAPVPGRDELEVILTAAARSPDHGKLEPWRFIVLEAGAMPRLAALAEARGAALGLEAEKVAKGVSQFAASPLAVVVVYAPVAQEKVPEEEQVLSAGAVCLALVNAALASGWGANWLSGWVAHDRAFVRDGLGLAEHERVAGIVHIGTPRATPPERPRPDLGAKTTWVNA
jgi:nitroreductase